jgi:hypothetical protein
MPVVFDDGARLELHVPVFTLGRIAGANAAAIA